MQEVRGFRGLSWIGNGVRLFLICQTANGEPFETWERNRLRITLREGKQVLSDLEKRCHYHTSTNVKGDSHESAYQEGQRSILLFIKQMLQKEKDK